MTRYNTYQVIFILISDYWLLATFLLNNYFSQHRCSYCDRSFSSSWKNCCGKGSRNMERTRKKIKKYIKKDTIWFRWIVNVLFLIDFANLIFFFYFRRAIQLQSESEESVDLKVIMTPPLVQWPMSCMKKHRNLKTNKYVYSWIYGNTLLGE